MSRVDDVIDNFIHTRGCAGLDDLMAKGFIRKNREDDNFVMYELGLKTE